MQGQYDKIDINKHGDYCAYFIVSTISYNKYCTIKISIVNVKNYM